MPGLGRPKQRWRADDGKNRMGVDLWDSGQLVKRAPIRETGRTAWRNGKKREPATPSTERHVEPNGMTKGAPEREARASLHGWMPSCAAEPAGSFRQERIAVSEWQGTRGTFLPVPNRGCVTILAHFRPPATCHCTSVFCTSAPRDPWRGTPGLSISMRLQSVGRAGGGWKGRTTKGF